MMRLCLVLYDARRHAKDHVCDNRAQLRIQCFCRTMSFRRKTCRSCTGCAVCSTLSALPVSVATTCGAITPPMTMASSATAGILRTRLNLDRPHYSMPLVPGYPTLDTRLHTHAPPMVCLSTTRALKPRSLASRQVLAAPAWVNAS
jgi:hypothetical protein